MRDMPRPARSILGVIGLFIIASLVWNWWGDYREESARESPGTEATETVAPPEGAEAPEGNGEDAPAQPESPVASGQTVVVLIEGLNFRRQPSRDGELIGGLGRGTRLEHLGTADGWHHVRDANGVEGYVSASEQYTELQ